jgi:hypothetical protein
MRILMFLCLSLKFGTIILFGPTKGRTPLSVTIIRSLSRSLTDLRAYFRALSFGTARTYIVSSQKWALS